MNALSPFDCKIKTSLEVRTHFKRQQRIIRQNDYSLIIAEISAKIKAKIWQMVNDNNCFFEGVETDESQDTA